MSEDHWGLSSKFEGYMQRHQARQAEVIGQLNDHRRMNGTGNVPMPPQVPAHVPDHLSMPVVPQSQAHLASPQLVACLYCRNQGIFNCANCNQLMCQFHMQDDGVMCTDCQARLDAEMQASLQKYDQEHPQAVEGALEQPAIAPPVYDLNRGVEMLTSPMPLPTPPAGSRKQIADYHLISMHAADRELWDRMMASEIFSHHFHELLKMASGS